MKTTQRVEFGCCYISDGVLNAHTYKAEVTVSGHQRYLDSGVVLRFEVFKNYLKQTVPDKHFIYQGTDRMTSVIADDMKACGVPTLMLNKSISCEALCEYIAQALQGLLYNKEPGVSVQSVKLREASDSYATWGVESL